MPNYHYRCTVCNAEHELHRKSSPPSSPPLHCGQPAKRIFGFSIVAPFQEGYNPSLGMHVSNKRILNDALKVASDHASENTQLTHSFVMRDANDHAAFGLSDTDVAEAKEYADRIRIDGAVDKGNSPWKQKPQSNSPRTVPDGVSGGWESPPAR